MRDKQPMQADGGGSGNKLIKKVFVIASRRGGTGESGGGEYTNPHTKGKDDIQDNGTRGE